MPLTDLRALVVDPDPSNAKLLVVVLRAEGADARSASDAESALALLAYFRPQLVITEIVLPGKDGLELARTLRARTPAMKIVIVTSLNGPETQAAALVAGADVYVQKPIDPAAFVTRMTELMASGGDE